MYQSFSYIIMLGEIKGIFTVRQKGDGCCKYQKPSPAPEEHSQPDYAI